MSRGRKEGSVSGKRPIFWVCIGYSDKLFVDKIYSINNSSDEEIKSFTSEEAAKIFKNKYKLEPDQVIGPCYDVKSLNKSMVSKAYSTKDSNKVENSTNISSILGTGSYNGWFGTVFSISGNSDEVLFIASERADDNLNKILPTATPIKKELIQFV